MPGGPARFIQIGPSSGSTVISKPKNRPHCRSASTVATIADSASEGNLRRRLSGVSSRLSPMMIAASEASDRATDSSRVQLRLREVALVRVRRNVERNDSKAATGKSNRRARSLAIDDQRSAGRVGRIQHRLERRKRCGWHVREVPRRFADVPNQRRLADPERPDLEIEGSTHRRRWHQRQGDGSVRGLLPKSRRADPMIEIPGGDSHLLATPN